MLQKGEGKVVSSRTSLGYSGAGPVPLSSWPLENELCGLFYWFAFQWALYIYMSY